MRRALLLVTVGLAIGCADYAKVATPADEARLEAETHLTFLPRGQAQAGDGVVRIITHHSFCSGALVSDAIVVTAEHCVTELGEQGFQPIGAGYVRVELGKDALPWGRVSASHVFMCPNWNGDAARDVAAIVLEKRVPPDVTRLKPKLDDGDIGAVGAPFVAQGFGTGMTLRTMPLTGSAIWSAQRTQRTGALVWSGDDDFMVAMSSDHGDSGGPVLAEASGEFVGVASEKREDRDTGTPITIASRLAPCADVLAQAAAAEQAIGG